jgi:hypothetical protein
MALLVDFPHIGIAWGFFSKTSIPNFWACTSCGIGLGNGLLSQLSHSSTLFFNVVFIIGILTPIYTLNSIRSSCLYRIRIIGRLSALSSRAFKVGCFQMRWCSVAWLPGRIPRGRLDTFHKVFTRNRLVTNDGY